MNTICSSHYTFLDGTHKAILATPCSYLLTTLSLIANRYSSKRLIFHKLCQYCAIKPSTCLSVIKCNALGTDSANIGVGHLSIILCPLQSHDK